MFKVSYLLLSKCYGTRGIHACISLDSLEQGQLWKLTRKLIF